jgi:hypothetical protein
MNKEKFERYGRYNDVSQFPVIFKFNILSGRRAGSQENQLIVVVCVN